MHLSKMEKQKLLLEKMQLDDRVWVKGDGMVHNSNAHIK